MDETFFALCEVTVPRDHTGEQPLAVRVTMPRGTSWLDIVYRSLSDVLADGWNPLNVLERYGERVYFFRKDVTAFSRAVVRPGIIYLVLNWEEEEGYAHWNVRWMFGGLSGVQHLPPPEGGTPGLRADNKDLQEFLVKWFKGKLPVEKVPVHVAFSADTLKMRSLA